MKRILVLIMVVGLVAGSVATAEAAKKKKKKKAPATYSRTFEGTYDAPALGIGGIVTWGITGGTVESSTLENENFISVEVVDGTGTDVYFGISQEDTNGDGIGEIIAGGCGKTEAPIAITAGLTHAVTVTMGPGAEDMSCAGVATSGTIKMTFTTVP